MAGDLFPDPEVGAAIKEAAERQARAAAERARREAEARGELERAQAKKIVGEMDAFDGRPAYRDELADIVARIEEEE